MDDKLLTELRKSFGAEVAFRLNEPGRVGDIQFLSTGIATLDQALGGGVPAGRIIELYGPESSGKSTIASAIVGNLQTQYHYDALYIDMEYALNLREAKQNGMNVDDVVISQPDTAEQAMAIIERGQIHGDY